MKTEFIFQPINQYVQLLHKGCWNWINFNIITIEFELGAYDLTFIILGIGFYFRINWKETEMTESLKKMIKEIEKK
jgi:hypothetical protein